jgi:hypothetical protein
MKKRATRKTPKATVRKRRTPPFAIPVTEDELRNFEVAADGRDLKEWAKSILARAVKGKSKKVGESGNRTQPNESDPPAVHKAAAPPRRGRLADGDKDSTLAPAEGSAWSGTTSREPSRVDVVAAQMREWHAQHPGATPRQSARQIARFVWERVANDDPGGAADFFTSLLWETDRGCVLVAAQVIDEELEEMLRAFCTSRSAVTDKELNFWFDDGGTPPLQSTALKIQLSFALGLIERPLLESLLKLQRLRSRQAAHARKPFELTTDHSVPIFKPLPEAVRAACNEFFASDALDQLLHGFAEPLSPAKAAFAVIVSMLFELLERAKSRMVIGQSTGQSVK